MKVYEMSNKITALSALRRRSSAPQLVVVAPSGAGKSTLIYLLLGHRLIPYMRIGIGEKNQTTIISSEFCFDERIEEEAAFAIQITRKDYADKDIHLEILTILMDLFIRNGHSAEDTMDAFDEKTFEQIIEPKEAHYHLGQIRDDVCLDELKAVLAPVLAYVEGNDFELKVKQRREALKGKKVKLQEVREMVFEEMFEEIPKEITSEYKNWLKKIGCMVEERLRKTVGNEVYSQAMVEYSLDGESKDEGIRVLETLFDPYAPYGLVIDHISIACRPRKELVDIARAKSPDLPFRFCIRDTMGLTQKGIDATSTKEGLEAALSCKANTILFLLSLEERDDTLKGCCSALIDKKKELEKKGQLDTAVYVLFTKADRKVENLINKRNTGDLYIREETYTQNIHDVLADIEKTVCEYADILPQKEVGWLSMRYLEDSYILKALEGDERKRNFEPEGLFEKIVDYAMKTLRGTLPGDIENPLFVTAIEPDKPAIQVSVNPEKIRDEIERMQQDLCENRDIVNGYIIGDLTPRLHGKSVYTYWSKLKIGLGHSTRASVYGNFSINMKGLLKRMLTDAFVNFEKFNTGAISFTADNLEDSVLMETLKTLSGNDAPEAGMNPVLGDRNIALQRLYEFYIPYFRDRCSSLIDRVAYDLSYGNPELKQRLTRVYNDTPGYDNAMRELQKEFKNFFGSADFTGILISELGQAMTEMVNKAFIII